MPNHVKNRITAPKAIIDRLVGQDDDGKPCVDFNRIILRPEAINNESIGRHVKGAAEIALGLIDFRPTGVDFVAATKQGRYGDAASEMHRSNCTRQLLDGPMSKDFSDKDFDVFIGYLRAYRDCNGLMDWYDWNCKMWGTKWNAYDFERPSDGVVIFDTAWSAPHPVIEQLHKVTTTAFRHEWADEDTGSNVGVREYLADSAFNEMEYSGMREGYELCFALRPGYAEDYKLVDGNYEYAESETDEISESAKV